MKPLRVITTLASLLALLASVKGAEGEPASDSEEEGSVLDKLCDPRDGCLDLSRFLDEPAGFVPLIIPITEPALGGGRGDRADLY